MELIADILLVAGAFGAGVYCLVLARRLKRFNDLEKGVGGAVAVMSAQVDDMTKTLASAREISGKSTEALNDLTTRAEDAARRLELLIASLHDVPLGDGPSSPAPNAPRNNGSAAPGNHAQVDAPMFVRHDRTTEARG